MLDNVNPDDINLEDIILGPDDEPPSRARKKDQRRRKRPGRPRSVKPLGELSGLFVRVPVQWLADPGPLSQASWPEVRLFLYALFRSQWGQRGVKVTNEFAAEVGIPGSTKRWALARLERKGLIRIERHARRETPIIWPIIPAGGPSSALRS
jgi:hypothetical protein